MNRKNKKNNLNDNVKVEMVSADNMTEEERQAIFNRKASVDAIPDLDVLTSHVYEILLYLYKPSTIELMKVNESAVKMYLNNKYADTVPLGIITLLMEGENIEENINIMLNLFESLQKAKKGEISLDEGETKLAKQVCDKYEYSKYGSQEAFEKALMNEITKEQQKKSKENIKELKNTGKARIKN